jgi:serine/threonine protein phosphatase 1
MKRHLIIGDIHGCYAELQQLVSLANLQADEVLVSVGDIVDRGPDSLKVYEFFKKRPNSVVIMGNHERKHLRQVLSFGQEIVKMQMGEKYPEFLEWLATLGYYYETEAAVVVHGGFEEGVSIELQREEVLSGATAGENYLRTLYGEKFWSDFYSGEKPIIWGHHVTGDLPMILPNKVYGIDTGACHGGYLTAISLPDFEIFQVKSARNYWLQEIALWEYPILKAKPWAKWKFERVIKEIEARSHSTNADVKAFLSEKEHELSDWKALIPNLIAKIHLKINALLAEKSEADFNKYAHGLPFSALFFAAKKGHLTEELVWTSANTPEKFLELKAYLEKERA